MVDDDAVLVGFGGCVAGLRLSATGYRVGLLEAGWRFADEELATTSWRLREPVPRPAPGADYQRQRLDPTPPRSPAVPASALAALRLGRS